MTVESRMPCCPPSRDRLTLTFIPATKGGTALPAQILKEMDSIYNVSCHLPGLECPDVWAETGNEQTYQDVL